MCFTSFSDGIRAWMPLRALNKSIRIAVAFEIEFSEYWLE